MTADLTHPYPIEALNRHAITLPEKPAIITQEGEITYRGLDLLVTRMVHFMRSKGVSEDEVIILAFRDELSTMVASLSAMKLGLTIVVIPSHTSQERMRDLQLQVSATWILTDLENAFDAALYAPISLVLKNKDHTEFEDTHINPSRLLLIVQGSGTTGNPKLLPYTYGYLPGYIHYLNKTLKTGSATVYARTTPCSFISGLTGFFAAVVGGYTATTAIQDMRDLKRMVQRHGVTDLNASVLHMEQYLSTLSDTNTIYLENLRALRLSFSAVSPSLIARLKAHVTKNIHNLYGTNEGGICMVTPPDLIGKTEGSVGKPLPWVSVEVVNDADQPLPAGQAGLIRFKTPSLITGYLNDPGSSEKAFRGGWFYPGDIGKFTEGGELIHLGRSDHTMIFNGINIHPSEIENIALGHPAIMDAAVVPFKHPIHQDVPICAVVLNDGSSATSEQLIDYFSTKMRAKFLHHIFIIEEIPRNHQGKLLRTDLAKIIKEKLEE